MKFRFNRKYTQIAIYAVIVIVLSGFLLMSMNVMPNLSEILNKITSAFAPVVWGCVIAYLLNPGVDFFRFKVFKKYSEKADTLKKRNFIRNISVLIVFLLAAGLVTGLVFLIMPQLTTSMKGLIDKFDVYVDNFIVWFNNVFGENAQLSELLSNPLAQIEQYITGYWTDISKSIVDLGATLGGNVLGLLVGLKDFIIGIIFAIYILVSKDMLKSQVKRIFFAFFRNSTANAVFHVSSRTNDIFCHYVTSNLIDALIIGCATFIFASIAQIPYSIVITVIVAVTNIIPFFGPFLGGIPSFLLILLVDPIKALWFGIFIIVLQQCDGNIIKPLLFGETMGLPAIWVLVSIILGGNLFGLPGTILGVPVFSVLYILTKEFLSSRLEKKNLPSEGQLYNRGDLDKYVDGYEYTDKERAADEKWLESNGTPKKERKIIFLKKLEELHSKKSD
ncbi:MAG: AI-2E family transporter [Oscillospiraceae bacterium]|nr:AI-2E family transporter [Oscillospiraceae bacterium]